MAFNSANFPDPACNMPSATYSGPDCALDLSLLGILDDEAWLRLYSSTLELGEPWPFSALPAPSTGFDLQNCASSASNPEIPSTQNCVCGQVCARCSPRPVPSPATSTESFSPFGLEHAFDDITPSISPVVYSGLAFPSPATMGQDSTLPFSVGSTSPADVVAHEAQSTTAHMIPGVFSPCSAASSLACHPVVSSASLVQVSSTLAQRGSLRQESLFTTSAGQPWHSPPSFPITLSALHSTAPSYPLPASASLTALPHQESHPLSKRSGAAALPRSASLPVSLKTHGAPRYQGPSSIEDANNISGAPMHPSLALPVPAVKVAINSSSPHLRGPRASIPASPHTNYHNAIHASAHSATSSPSGAVSPLVATTNALNTPSLSDVAEDVSTGLTHGIRIRKTGLKRTHACDQCSQSYVRAEHLRRHVKSKHMGLKEHACGSCDFRCSRSDNLRQHVRTMHDA